MKNTTQLEDRLTQPGSALLEDIRHITGDLSLIHI